MFASLNLSLLIYLVKTCTPKECFSRAVNEILPARLRAQLAQTMTISNHHLLSTSMNSGY